MADRKRKIENMGVRTASAIVMLIVLCIAVFIAPSHIGVALFSIISAIIAYEFTFRTGLVISKSKVAVSSAFASVLPWLFYYGEDSLTIIFAVFIFVCVLFVMSIVGRKNDADDILPCFFGGFFLPGMFSLVTILFDIENGKLLLVIPFLSAWMADCFAHIIGSLFGKHKLMPHISPKKTVEGALGGLVGSVAGMLIYGSILTWLGYGINYGFFALMGVSGALLGLCGDLSLSLVKRKCGIKDYGNLIPGHGGVLDRFDSVIFVMPVCMFIIKNSTLIY